MKNNILTFFISIIFSILLIELFFKFFNPQELNTPFNVVDDKGLVLNSKNNKTYHSFSNINVQYNFGQFHNREYGFDKKKDRILVLGDSFTFGWLLQDKETFVYKLNNKFKDYYFINSATGGWGTSDQLTYLIKFCEKIKPKYSLLFINSEDIFRSYNSNLFYLNKSGDLISGKNQIKKFTKLTENSLYVFLNTNLHSVRFLKKMYVSFFISTNQKNKANISENINKKEVVNYDLPKSLFVKMNEEIKKCKTKLFLINLAWEDIETYERLSFFKENKDFLKKNNISFIDLNKEMKVIQDNKNKYEIKNDGHPNELANEYFYQIISNKLENILSLN